MKKIILMIALCCLMFFCCSNKQDVTLDAELEGDSFLEGSGWNPDGAPLE